MTSAFEQSAESIRTMSSMTEDERADTLESSSKGIIIHEKENTVGRSRSGNTLGKSASDASVSVGLRHSVGVPSPSALKESNHKYFGPRSPVHTNLGSHDSKGCAIPKVPIRSRQEQKDKVSGTIYQCMITNEPKSSLECENISANTEQRTDVNNENTDRKAQIEEADEISICEETNPDVQEAGNNNIINQSKKFMDFLGGSIMTVLNNNQVPSKKPLHPETVGNISLSSVESYSKEDVDKDKLNPTSSTSLPALPTESRNANEISRDEVNESTDVDEEKDAKPEETDDTDNDDTNGDEESPLSQPKQKYWETLMLTSEESHLIHEYEDGQSFDDTPSLSPLKQREAKLTLLSTPGNKANMANDIFEDKGSPESIVLAPDDYSPGGSAFGSKKSPQSKGVASRADRSPESLLCNVISTAITNEIPMVYKSTSGTNEDRSISEKLFDSKPSPQSMISIPEDYSPGEKVPGHMRSSRRQSMKPREPNSPGSSMHSMISSTCNFETPTVCKNGQGVTCRGNTTDSSPVISEFCNMLSSATAAQTPILDMKIPHKSVVRNEPIISNKEKSRKMNSISSKNVTDDLLGDTPVKCNRTQLFRQKSNASIESNCDESEDGSIFTSASYQSSIQSNSPRNRRIMEWVGPDDSNTVPWTGPCMATNLKSSDIPERQLQAANNSTKPKSRGQHLTSQQTKSKSKSARGSNLWVPRLQQLGGTLSPTSLPSILGPESLNEVSDLESPNIIMPPLNFKFSDEESTIQSQSIDEACDIHSIPDADRLRRAPSPQSLMTVDTPTMGFPTDEAFSPGKRSANTKEIPNNASSKAKVSNLAAKGSGSPHSTITNESFEQGFGDKESKSSRWLKRCIMAGMLVALIGGVTVLVLTFIDRTNLEQPISQSQPNADEEWMRGIKIPTWPPISTNFSFRKTVPPTQGSSSMTSAGTEETYYPLDQTNLPTYYPTSLSTPKTTTKPALRSEITIAPTSSPTVIQTEVMDPLPTNTSSPIQARPSSKPTLVTSKPVITSVSVSEPSIQPTSKENPIPTFSNEKLQKLIWDRTIKGEELWRQSTGETVETPLWYFAAEDSPGIQVEVINAAKGDRIATQLSTAVDDYKESKAVSSLKMHTVPYEFLCPPPEAGQIKVCSGDFGNTDWIGSTIFFMRGEHIVSALIRVNEGASSPKGDALLQYSLCHQLGHALGLGHRPVDFISSSCMADLSENEDVNGKTIRLSKTLQHPNSDDLESLVTMYGAAGSRRLRGS